MWYCCPRQQGGLAVHGVICPTLCLPRPTRTPRSLSPKAASVLPYKGKRNFTDVIMSRVWRREMILGYRVDGITRVLTRGTEEIREKSSSPVAGTERGGRSQEPRPLEAGNGFSPKGVQPHRPISDV